MLAINVWFEITTLLIPDENDSPEEIKQECEWILENLGDSVPLHFTAFHPDFRMRDREPTTGSTLNTARKIAQKMGIKYCYVGNVFNIEGQTTYCPNCGYALIKRNWHSILNYKLKDNKCPKCSTEIPGAYYKSSETVTEINK